ncbi:MAG: hypothetical protein AAF849_01785 [Bacteroidota bacterium]
MNFKFLKQSFFTICFLAFGMLSIQGQGNTLVGFLDNKLVSIDENTAELEEILEFSPAVDWQILAFTYDEKNCVFYGTATENGQQAPPFRLYKFDLEGNSEIVGTLSIADGTIFVCDGLAFSSVDQKLYASASLNGGTAISDFASESIIEIDPATGNASKIVEVDYNNGDMPDVDKFVFTENTVYLFDFTSDSASKFYKADLSNLIGSVLVPEQFLVVEDGIRFPGFGQKDGDLFLATNSYELFKLDLETNMFNLIGSTHTANDFNGAIIRGLVPVADSKIDDDDNDDDTHDQESTLVGFLDNRLVGVDENTAEIEELLDFSPAVDWQIRGFTYDEKNCVFYGTATESNRQAPPFRLYKFDLEGNSEIIGILSIPNATISLCETISYNPEDGKLYSSVSLNGGIAVEDFFSETIVEIDPTTAVCTKVVEINYNNGDNTDVDDLIFVDNILYLFDGQPPSPNVSKFYKIDFSTVSTDVITPELFLTDEYLTIGGFGFKDGKIFFPTNDAEFYELDLESNEINFIGFTHDPNEYNGAFLRGINPISNKKLGIDIGTEPVKGAPKAFTYQGLATDTRSGRVIKNRDISIEASIIKDEPEGEVVYTEVHDLMTDNFGFFSTAIGAGFPTLGSFANIDWSSGCYFLQISIDIRGGSDYSLLGVTQLLSVPYALYADQAGSVKNDNVIMQSPNGKCWKMSVSNDGQPVFTEVACD